MGGKTVVGFTGKPLPQKLPFVLFGIHREIVTVFRIDRTVVVPVNSRNVTVAQDSRVIVVPQSDTESVVQ